MWQPSAPISVLTRRADILRTIRAFFYQRQVMEVETPCLSQATVTDQHLSSFTTEFVGPGYADGKVLYLQTSPEYAMKRLLAAGSGSIFQLFKAFRNEEAGRFHNPEFTLLEWYRLDFDHFALMDEVEALLMLVLNCSNCARLTYQQAFIEHVGLDPLSCNIKALQHAACEHGMENIAADENNIDTLLQLLFSQCVETKIGLTAPCFIYNFPASQAALAKICPQDPRVAERFEVYYSGIELANGFHELTDSQEQLARFEQDNLDRDDNGQMTPAIDLRLIEALSHGLPSCAGVALGIDRLVMLALGVDSIEQVLAFDINRS